MTNEETNQYICHYVERDHTNRAIMLTGAWGVGKSFYIKNVLVPFLSSEKNGAHKCIVVSLYGISSLTDISKLIYLESRAKFLNYESEGAKAGLLLAKTVLKGITSIVGLNLQAKDSDLQALYQSIDLSDKLIIFEDVERASISVLEFLGYVNSLVEQDGVKVLLVTNEEEMIKYDQIQEASTDGKAQGTIADRVKNQERTTYTQETVQYLRMKEKTVGDTIVFWGDFQTAIKQIINKYYEVPLNRFTDDKTASDISSLMYIMETANLRAIIYACQKTADIIELIGDSFSDDFYRTVFYGVVCFSLRLHAGIRMKWTGLDDYSQELGISGYPLFRFCYDYIMKQKFNPESVPVASEALKTLRLFDKNKSSNDPDIQILDGFYRHSEVEVQGAAERIINRLSNPEDISFYDYGRIAANLVLVKHFLHIDIDGAKTLLVNNLRGRGNKIKPNSLFNHTIAMGDVAQSEFQALREDMIAALGTDKLSIPNFSYQPEQAIILCDYTTQHHGDILTNRGFARFLDISRLVEMISNSTPAQMDDMRKMFLDLYRPSNIKEYLAEDESAIAELLEGIETTWERSDVDQIKLLQYQWFIENLKDIHNRLV